MAACLPCAGEEEARDPCLPVGYSRTAPTGTVIGSGNFEECRAIAKGLIAGQCQDELCPIGDSIPVELQGEAFGLATIMSSAMVSVSYSSSYSSASCMQHMD